MNHGNAIFVSLSLLSAAFVISAWMMAIRLAPEQRQREEFHWLLRWSVRGLALPVALWAMLNIGLSWSLQPFMPEVQFAQNSGGKWGGVFLGVLGEGIFIAGSYWAALTLGWVICRAATGLHGESRSDFKALCTTCLLGMSLPAIGITWLGGLPILGLATSLILGPFAVYAPNILRVKKTPPMYARAIARMKFGKYNEAEMEIIRELEKCEDDFDGWMMLAELYAKQFNDVNEAERTVLEICDQPRTTPSQLSVALHRLSEWHLNLADDPDRARRALQMICNRLPGTHLAHMAQLRIQQLPGSIEALHEMRHPKPIPVPAYNPRLAALRAASEAARAKEAAVGLANRCVETLTKDPNDVPAREELAHVMAEHLNQVEQGLEQLTLLLNMPEQPAAKRAEWLSLAAAWHINHRKDFDTGRKTLERVIREFPESAEATAARRRVHSLDLENS